MLILLQIKTLLIVITGNFLMIYTLENGEISEKPIKKIDIKKGESVIMVEWATGDYVARWGKKFLTNSILTSLIRSTVYH